MPTDSRSSSRHAASFDVRMHYGARPPISCVARNLSVEGMLLEVAQADLAIGDQVDLSISLREGVFSVQAVVLHSNTDCTGVMFCRPQPALYSIIARPMSYGGAPINGRIALSAAVPGRSDRLEGNR